MSGAEKAIMCAYDNPGCTGIVGAPTYPMLHDATLPHLLNRLELHRIPYTIKRGNQMQIELHECRATMLLRSMSDADRLRGTNIAWFWIDEMTYCVESAFQQLEARLRDPRARKRTGFGSWTPRGFDWVWRRFISHERAFNYSAVLARAFENSYLPEDFYVNLAQSYSPQFARQEVLGEYLNIFSGRAYPQFDREQNVWPFETRSHTAKDFRPIVDPVIARRAKLWQDCKYNPGRPLIWALDFNINPACSIVAQTLQRTIGERLAVTDIAGDGRADMQINVLEELFLENRTTYEVCDEFMHLIEQLRESHQQQKIMVYIYGDPAGEQRHSSAQRTDWQIIKDFIHRNENKIQASFRVRSAHSPVKDRINCVNWACCSATGDRRLLVHKRCKNLVADLEQVGWKVTPTGNMLAELDKSRDPKLTHISDALGYFIEKEWPMRSRAGLKPGILL